MRVGPAPDQGCAVSGVVLQRRFDAREHLGQLLHQLGHERRQSLVRRVRAKRRIQVEGRLRQRWCRNIARRALQGMSDANRPGFCRRTAARSSARCKPSSLTSPAAAAASTPATSSDCPGRPASLPGKGSSSATTSPATGLASTRAARVWRGCITLLSASRMHKAAEVAALCVEAHKRFPSEAGIGGGEEEAQNKPRNLHRLPGTFCSSTHRCSHGCVKVLASILARVEPG